MTQYATGLSSIVKGDNTLGLRKRAGQYFSGVGLARLLAAVAYAASAETILDPMVGIGDMLAGCLDIGAAPRLLGGIEIDPALSRRFSNRIPGAFSLRANAFDP